MDLFVKVIRLLIIYSGLIYGIYAGFVQQKVNKLEVITLNSPNKNIKLNFFLQDGKPYYNIVYKKDSIILNSALDFQLPAGDIFSKGAEIIKVTPSAFSEVWKPVWGEDEEILNRYNETKIELRTNTHDGTIVIINFRAFNDGVGFRYEFPSQPGLALFEILKEKTEFNLSGDPFAWWIPANYVSDEMLYNDSKLSQVDSIIKNNAFKGANELYMENVAGGKAAFNTPITLKTENGTYLSFHEAGQLDYPDMTLALTNKNGKFGLISDLVPLKDSVKAIVNTPYNTPWRTIQVGDKPGDLLESHLIVNLNDPSEIKDAATWCKPMKYIGIWWGYHIGKWAWDPNHPTLEHGATTLNAKRYIDFAARHGIKGLLIEGWNTFLPDSLQAPVDSVDTYSHKFRDYTKGHEDYDFFEVVRYAKQQGVELIVHNETMGAVQNYENQLEKAFRLYDSLGIHYIKTGYAWYIENKEHFHHDQWMIKHYTKVMELAAKYHINVDVHESNKDTGLRRKYPNMFTREAVRGNEYNAWDKAHGNPPEHETIIPFTRMLAGPIDFTPGIFDLEFDQYKKVQRVNTTKAKQLALYVVLYSPLVMAADLIENYENDPAFKFITDVPVTWSETKVLDAVIGDYVSIARRSGEEWYLGAITDENNRTLKLKFTFLEGSKKYEAEVYQDGPETDLRSNPGSIKISRIIVDKSTVLPVELAQSGGIAVRLRPVGKGVSGNNH